MAAKLGNGLTGLDNGGCDGGFWALSPIGQLEDRSMYFAPVGELPVDEHDQRVQCHLCGAWFRALPTHLRFRHESDADSYRLAFGLRATRPLQAPDLSAVQAVRMRERMREDPRIQDGMKLGIELARAGDLNKMGRRRDQQLGRALERQEASRRTGERIGRERAQQLRAAREARARELGFADLEVMLRESYERDGIGVAELAERLGCAEITVVGDMERPGIARRPMRERLALGRRALADRRAARRAAVERRARDLGFASLGEYLVDRHHRQRWRHEDIGRELGITAAGAVGKLLDAEGVKRLRGSVPAGVDPGEHRGEQLAAARAVLADRRRALERELAARLAAETLEAWYAARLADGATHNALAREAGVSEKWLRLTRKRVLRPQ